MADCGGMVLEEQPAKMAECLRCFLQGLGYVTNLSVTHHSLSNRLSNEAMKQRELLAKTSGMDGENSIVNTVNLDIPYTDGPALA